MKTLLITLEYPPQVGGIASYVLNFVSHLPSNDVVVYAPPQSGDKAFDASHPWKTYRKRPYWRFFWPRWLRLFFQVRTIVKQEKINQLYVHHALPVGYIGYLIKKFRKIPYTLFLHGTDVEMATRHPSKLKKFSRVCRAAERIVVNSQFLKNKLTERVEGLQQVVILSPAPADNFLQPVPAEKLNKLRAELALSGKRVMLTVGRMVDGKGYPHLLRLIPELLRQVPNLVWLIVGEGPKRQQLFDDVQKNYLQNVVRFLGVQPQTELPTYYQLADLFVLLTHPDETAEEGWGTVYLEAAASGLPVVAGRVGGVEEAVENMVTGVVVDVHQEKAVLSSIAELLKNPEYAKQMGEKGRERVLREFTWEKQLLSLRGTTKE